MVIKNKSFDINRLDSYDRTILKERAKKELREHESYLMIATLIFMVATIIIASLFYNKDDNLGVAIIKDFVSAILVGTFSMSCYTFMQAYHNKTVDQFIKHNSSFDLFMMGFSNKYIGSSIITYIIRDIYIALWTMLFIVPGIIKSYAYAMVPFVLKDYVDSQTPQNPPSANKILAESELLMKGHKWDYFVLKLTFIGWIMFSVITFGLGLVYVIPYIRLTSAEFYEELKKANDLESNGQKPVESVVTKNDTLIDNLNN